MQVTHHVTERRSKSMSRSVCDRLLDHPRPVSFALLTDHGKKRMSRGREKSRDRLAGFILGDRIRDKPKENHPRDRSIEKLLRHSRSKEKLFDRHRDRQHDPDEKLQGKSTNNSNNNSSKMDEKGNDQRKLSKQNTYIFQNGRSTKVKERRQEADAVKRLNRSIENLDYSRVVDDISPLREAEEGEDNHYAEICDYINDKKDTEGGGGFRGSSSNHAREKRKSTGDREMNGFHDPHHLDNNLSFTLLKKDIGGYYVKIPGFDLPKIDLDHNGHSEHNRSYDSLC